MSGKCNLQGVCYPADHSIEGEALRGFFEDGRDLLKPFVFHERREVADEQCPLFLLIFRVCERECRCSYGLRVVRIFKEKVIAMWSFRTMFGSS